MVAYSKNTLQRCFSRSAFQLQKDFHDILEEDSDYLSLVEDYFKFQPSKICYIIQPYVKWGPQKRRTITPDEQIEEAIALVKTLPSWDIYETIAVPLEHLDKKALFGSGSLAKLREFVHRNSAINSVFVNLGVLRKPQMINLEKEFRVPILDRYKIVMQILKLHAVTKHAKLQVALAELYYLQRTTIHEQNLGKVEHEKVKLMFQTREQKLKNGIKELRAERALLRNKRRKNEIPVVAVVGYTNGGKTSLIKALTGEDKLIPRNQLFATLDVTVHEGLLPSGLKVLYVDTVGFISDIPTNLIECFIATLEDAVLADVIVHVQDLSSSTFDFKKQHVLKTLEDLAKDSKTDILNKMLNVGTKCDLITLDNLDILKVSSKTDKGLDALRIEIESKILTNTNRRHIKIRVPSGSDDIKWLYKNATVIKEIPYSKDSQFVIAEVIISEGKINQFKHQFSPNK